MSQTTNPLNPASAHIYVKGKEFVYNLPPSQVADKPKTNRFVIKGVALSATGTTGLGIKDILADEHNELMTSLIIPKLSYLNINCIRVYQVNPNNSHKKTMDSLAAAGIYVMVGLATSTYSINRMTGKYGYSVFNHAAQVVNEFVAYNNTLCFSVGNEVQFPGEQANLIYDSNKSAKTSAIIEETKALQIKVARAMKSFARDVKAHIALKSTRSKAIPVGVAMQDGPQINWNNTNGTAYQIGIIGTDSIAQYYADGPESDRMDFIGINTYAYISGLGQKGTAYNRLGNEASTLPIPVFLSETGAITNPRTWAVVPEMYTNTNLYPQLSGQIAFQMLEEGAGFGLYTVGGTAPNYTLTAQANKGAADLATQFGATEPNPLNPASSSPAAPTTAPTSFGSNPAVTVNWPSSLLPAFTELKADTSITVENYSTSSVIQITQLNTVFGTVPKASNDTTPGSASIKVLAGIALSIQAQNGNNWDALCGVAASNVKSGITIKTDVNWGPYSGCNIDLGAGNSISININNYAENKIDVLVNNAALDTVAASTNGTTPTSKAVTIEKLGTLQLQEYGTNTPICNMTALMLQDGVTIENNLGWGQSCNIPIPAPGTMSINVENYSTTAEMKVYQQGWPIVTIDKAIASNKPSTQVVEINAINDIYLQYEVNTKMKVSCYVPISAVKPWMTIGNNVANDGDVCTIDYTSA